jgi:protein-S-isoprenylcysteine O-methyltransferase Ste14
MTGTNRPPPSVTSFGLNLVGVLAAMLAFYLLRERGSSGPDAVLLVCAAGVVPIVLLDVLVLRVHRRSSTGLDWDRPSDPDAARAATKLLGLAVTIAPFALAYVVFPEYGDWYGAFWNLLRRFGGVLVAVSVAYVWLVDGLMREPRDVYWQLGRLALFHPEDARKADIANHYRGWLIKAFYLPLFVVFTHNQLNGILTYRFAGLATSNLGLYHFLTDLIYAVDVLYATVGYVLSFRLIDTHVRSAEPTMLGWVVALECYPPFWNGFFNKIYLHYDGIGFDTWLAGHLSVRWVWAVVILVCEGIYLLATFAFGVRFSNLTNRGILTNGPYRYTKHPAYIAKNLSWWLITLPFIPNHGWLEAMKNTVGLAGVSTIYFLRARTEERHLSRDPAYVEYALWMNEHGSFRFLNRFSFFVFKPSGEATLPASTRIDGPPIQEEAEGDFPSAQ